MTDIDADTKNLTPEQRGFLPLPAGMELIAKFYITNGDISLTYQMASHHQPKEGMFDDSRLAELIASLPPMPGYEDQPFRAMTAIEIEEYKADMDGDDADDFETALADVLTRMAVAAKREGDASATATEV